MEIGGIVTALGSALSIGSGGLFGLLGSSIGAVAKYYQEEQRQGFEKAKWAHETRLLELQMKAREKEAEQELAIVSQEGAWSGLTEWIRAVPSGRCILL